MFKFSDIFKKSFIEGWTSQIDTSSVIIALIITAVLGLYIYFLYRMVTQKTFYSKSFNISLVGVSLITAAIIITIQSSIVISLGMVGALSIVRFRTAIKNPLDLMFLFWAVSIGIICGAGLSLYAVIMSVIVTTIVLFLDWLPIVKTPSILIVNATDIEKETSIIKIVKKYNKHFTVKARNITTTSLDLTIELSSVKEAHLMLKDLMSTEGISSASLLAHNGETSF